MAVESGYLQVVGTLWEWAKQDIGVWARALGNLKLLLSEQDLDSDAALVFALRFSAFSVFIAILVDLPPRIFFFSSPVNLMNTLGLFIVYYIDAVIAAVSSKLVATVMRSKISLRTCFMMSLFATVYWPVVNIGNYSFLGDKQLYKLSLSLKSAHVDYAFIADRAAQLVTMTIFSAFIITFILAGLIPATKYLFKVGNVRATTIVVGTYVLGSLAQVTLLSPLWLAIFKMEYGE
jgi:hypothetical protein